MKTYSVGKAHFRYPKSTDDVRPVTPVCLLEGSSIIWAEHAVHGSAGGLKAAAVTEQAVSNIGRQSVD